MMRTTPSSAAAAAPHAGGHYRQGLAAEGLTTKISRPVFLVPRAEDRTRRCRNRIWQSLKVYWGMTGQNPRSGKRRRKRRASTPYTTMRGFTSENRTISDVRYLNIGTVTMPVSQLPFRPDLYSKSAIRLNG